MPAFICSTCGTQYAPTEKPPAACPICDDERQYVPPPGQGWTTLDTLATMLTTPAGRLVFDRTGLAESFDVDLEYSTDQAPSDAPSIFAAVQEQLGLKLDFIREPVDVVVIDHVERPTED